MLLEIQNKLRRTVSTFKNFTFDHPGTTGLLIGILVLNAIFIRELMLRGWDPQDYGGFLNAGWRIVRGQKLYVDFHFHAGPTLIYVIAGALAIFKLSKTAVWATLLLDCTVGSLIVFWGSRRLKLPLPICVLMTLLTITGFHLGWPFPNYNSYTAFFGLCAIWIWITQIPFADSKKAFSVSFFSGIFISLAIMTKLTDGLALGFALFCTMLSAREHRHYSLYGYITGGLTGLALLLGTIPNLRSFFDQNFIYYNMGQLHRLKGFLSISSLAFHGYWMPVLLMLLVGGKRIFRLRELTVLTFTLYLATYIAFVTGTDKNHANQPLLGTLVTLIAVIIWRSFGEKEKSRRTVAITLLVLFSLAQIILCIFIGFKQRMPDCKHHLMGPCYAHTLKTQPLDGWKTYLYWGQALDRLVPIIKEKIPKTDSLFILADMQILDLLTDRTPYPGIPFQFVFGINPSPGDQQKIVRNNILSNQPDWILTYSDSGPFAINVVLVYMDLENFLMDNYQPVWGDAGYILCHKRNDLTANRAVWSALIKSIKGL